MKDVFAGVAVLLLIIGAVVGLAFGGFYLNAYFAPKYEAVRRDVMIQSRAYSEASTRELYRLKLQYLQARTDDERATIRAFVIHESAAFDRDRLPTDLQSFIVQLGG